MGNLTEAFSSIVSQIEKERGVLPDVTPATSPIGDTFVTECVDLFVHVNKLKSVLVAVRGEYLLTTSALDREDVMTEEQRDELDMNARVELRKFDEKLKYLGMYERKRQERGGQKTQRFKFNKSEIGTVNKHRDGILLSLSYELRNTSKLLLEMQNTRLSRKRDIVTGDFDGFKNLDYKALKYQPALNDRDYGEDEEAAKLDTLSEEQLQVLQLENSEILDAKLDDLQKVEQIHKSVIEIAQLESQLASHLSVQSESIRTLVNDHDMTEVDIVEGNKVLKKATGRGNWSTWMITWCAFIAGLILLLANRLKP